MSLFCVMCSKTIVLSENPDHYAVCSACPVMDLTQVQKKIIEDSNRGYGRK
jgi:hypothetical protein